MPCVTQSGPSAIINDPPQHWHAAKFILSIKERHTLSQSDIDCVISSTTSLMSSVYSGILSELKMDHEVPENLVYLLEEKFKSIESIFLGISTAYQQRKYFKDVFHKIVSKHTCMYK